MITIKSCIHVLRPKLILLDPGGLKGRKTQNPVCVVLNNNNRPQLARVTGTTEITEITRAAGATGAGCGMCGDYGNYGDRGS